MNLPEENIDNHNRAIAIKVIECLEGLIDLSEENISITTTHYSNPNYYTIEINNNKDNKLVINIHKIK